MRLTIRQSLGLLIPRPLGLPNRADIMAGITVAVVALPLAVALALASGAPASAGLYAAIFGGLIASIFGSSPLNISGPTGAMTVVLIGVVAEHGLVGMALAGLLAGIFQILLGLARAGRLITFLPASLIAGFTSGIAVVIFRGQIDTFMQAPVVGLITIAVMVAALLLWRNGPAALIALGAGIVANLYLQGPVVSGIPSGLPTPSLPIPDLPMLRSILSAAVAICLLGSIEGLLTASLVDSMKRSRHDPNRELVGQGMGNIVSALVGGVPITGAVARTGLAVRSGGVTIWTGIIHSLVLLTVVLVLGPYVHYIPLASLAGILMVTCVRMVEWHSIRLIPKATFEFNAVLIVTLTLTVFSDVIVAVAAGFGLATIHFLLGLSRTPLQETDSPFASDVEAHVAFHTVSGPLFFGVVRPILDELENSGKRVLVLDMRRVSLIDASGAMMLQDLAHVMHGRGNLLVLWGLEPRIRRSLLRNIATGTRPKFRVVSDREKLEQVMRKHLQESQVPVAGPALANASALQ